MSTGLLALLDDIAGIAKVAAASLDDVAAQAGRAGVKAAGVVIDDAAVTPRYVVGFAASRELPIVWKIAVGSVKNKLFYLLPAALALSYVAPWSITPLLMLGGAYLCYEGAEKIWHAMRPHDAHEDAPATAAPAGAGRMEDDKVRSAIQTDFILSAEIMALTLASLTVSSTVAQAAILAVVGIGITAVVYGGVALIVKADDVGLSLAGNDRPVSTLLGMRDRPLEQPAGGADRVMRPVTRGIGRGLVVGMPVFLRILGIVGTAAMLWVGGGILLHGLEGFGVTAPGHVVHGPAVAAAAMIPAIAAAAEWLVTAVLSGIVGFVVGVVLIPVAQYGISPLMALFKRRKVPA